MVLKLFQNIKKADRGTTLVELIVVVFIIALFSLITVSNFPQIQKQYALSAAAYSLAQDIRAAEDMGLSGAQTLSSDGQIISVKGYGFFARNFPTQGYFIYADISNGSQGLANQRFDTTSPGSSSICNTMPLTNWTGANLRDCSILKPNISSINSSLTITQINNIYGSVISNSSSQISINFMPPTPIVQITDNSGKLYTGIQIVLSNDGGTTTRKVLVNSYGLISVQ